MKNADAKMTPNEVARDRGRIDRAVKRAVQDALFAERAMSEAKSNAKLKAKKRKSSVR